MAAGGTARSTPARPRARPRPDPHDGAALRPAGRLPMIPGPSSGRTDEGDQRSTMTKVTAAIKTSCAGYVAGRNDGPGNGLGDGGERLHYWVFGGPWTYAEEPRGEATGEDAVWISEMLRKMGGARGGRGTQEAP